ncbi:Epimerase [Candidatus Desulfarcum epimagneticum]|uniref:Epimerase n=1 Tax=uncultured Desulfobacteraceae bacterium TaxID=218296 RepID=A0A484HKI5_9BACT|nr:Epimerase [uncultured Desulfobacteraceae bacterium]
MGEKFMRILITGSEGLIGRRLRAALAQGGHIALGCDIKADAPDEKGDIRRLSCLEKVAPEVDGIIHLAGVSRVIDGERDPEECMRTNAGGTKNVIKAAMASPNRPWILFSSSREVYGDPSSLPVPDTAALKPVNIYGESKAECERMLLDVRREGLRTGIVRLSNVYGDVKDHADRVVPAFCRAAATGGRIRVEGAQNTFDFTHVDDTARGLMALIDQLGQRENTPPTHLVTGRGVTLEELAKLAVQCGGSDCDIVERPSRSFDVSKFYGDPIRAEKYLGWSAKIRIEDGVKRLVADFKAASERMVA